VVKMRVAYGIFAALAVAMLCSGCPGNDTIDCTTNADCLQGGIPGTCLPSPSSSTRWCAFSDSTCPGGARWGVASGDGLAGMCLAEAPPDGGPDADIDAGPDAALPPDGELPPPLSTKIIVAARSQDNLFLFAADTLAPLSTAPLPDRVGNGNDGIGLAGNKLWVSSVQQILALDPEAVTVLAGFPKTIDSTTSCLAGSSIFRDPGLYCLVKQTGTAGDKVELHAGATLAVTQHLALPDPLIVGGSNTRIVVTYGTNGTSAAVLDANLAPVAGSPLTVPGSSGGQLVAVDDDDGRVAVSGGKTVNVFNRATLAGAGAHTFSANVIGLVFDPAHARLVVVLVDGHVAAMSTTDGAIVVAESLEVAATSNGSTPILDAPRGRIYLLTANESQLAVLDAATLHQIAGSPVSLPAQARAVTFY